eukprot:CAMPEP_0184492998 /NCGR_PEP_ID=MMETSP0113_2-20130426/24812_1 /TAXON_ID=91329 /ORGANISM="Norrisiella sphaerica, Strain BC52" /LENGTH=534 /DNA_ID=CAMNT_0026878087 /DNA_START=71 /DNA_END=1675 /DNA_ORIENTATION=+
MLESKGKPDHYAQVPVVEDAVVDEAKVSVVKPALFALMAGLGAFMFGYTLGFTSPALPAMYGTNNSQNVFTPKECVDGTVSSDKGSLFSSIVNIGAVVGALMAGNIADYFGRRLALASAAIPLGAGWVWLAAVRDPAQAIMARFVAGVGVGICSLVSPMYISEISPDQYRGALGSLNQLLITVGIFVVYLFGYLLPHENTVYDGCPDADTSTVGSRWTVLAWGGAILSGVLLFAALSLPESPVWLLAKGRRPDAVNVMRRLWGQSYDTEEYISMRDGGSINEGEENGNSHRGATLRDLFKPHSRLPMLIGCGLMLMQQWSGNNAVIFFCSSIFKQSGMQDTDLASLYVMGTQVAATALSVYLMDRAGRRLLLLVASTGMGVASGTLGLLFLLKHGSSSPPSWITILALMTYIIFFSIGMGPIPWLIMGEIFPDSTRALASSIATMVNWFSAFGVTFLFATMESSLKDYGTFWFYTCILGGAFMFVFILVPETKGLSNWEVQLALRRVAPCGGAGDDKDLIDPKVESKAVGVIGA